MKPEKVTVQSLQARKHTGPPITFLSAYDYPAAIAAERAGIDMILVGDSLGMVVLGRDNTTAVTMEEILHHCRAVVRGAQTPLIVGDMPFMSYQADRREAVRNAGRLLKEGYVDAVKIEGGLEIAETMKAIVDAGIASMGHIGLTPQSAAKLGGFKVQGRSTAAARKLIEDAKALEAAGAYAIVVEAVPDRLTGLITRMLDIPVLGIGAGSQCDGQAAILHDLIGFFDRFTPKFAKRYADLFPLATQALQQYRQDVEHGAFPGPEHSFTIKDDIFEEICRNED